MYNFIIIIILFVCLFVLVKPDTNSAPLSGRDVRGGGTYLDFEPHSSLFQS